MELYLDKADVKIIAKFHRTLLLAGVTTNPGIIAKLKREIFDVLSDIQSIVGEDKRLFAQTMGCSEKQIIADALALREHLPNIIIKIPVIPEGLAAIKVLSTLGIPTLGTAVYGAVQGFFSGISRAKYIAPYVNRIDAQGGNGIETVSELQTLLKQHQLNAKVCAAQLPHFTSGIRLLVGWLWFDYDSAGCG
ncbi:transaldolase family protein [Actinobacillus seminis]|uniref:transaldolase family protein n=1 Tax=Actinobacillus seminis TaxID=722 RepID=UPI001F3E5112